MWVRWQSWRGRCHHPAAQQCCTHHVGVGRAGRLEGLRSPHRRQVGGAWRAHSLAGREAHCMQRRRAGSARQGRAEHSAVVAGRLPASRLANTSLLLPAVLMGLMRSFCRARPPTSRGVTQWHGPFGGGPEACLIALMLSRCCFHALVSRPKLHSHLPRHKGRGSRAKGLPRRRGRPRVLSHRNTVE